MDNGLVPVAVSASQLTRRNVLILVVVDNGLVQAYDTPVVSEVVSLNPCCSGQWSSTRPYKTLLIINKLKNFTKEIFTILN